MPDPIAHTEAEPKDPAELEMPSESTNDQPFWGKDNPKPYPMEKMTVTGNIGQSETKAPETSQEVGEKEADQSEMLKDIRERTKNRLTDWENDVKKVEKDKLDLSELEKELHKIIDDWMKKRNDLDKQIEDGNKILATIRQEVFGDEPDNNPANEVKEDNPFGTEGVK
jgi:hypothetical protein